MGRMVSFNRSNWISWKTKLENIYCKELNGSIEDKEDRPQGMKDVEWKKPNRKAFGVIIQWIDYDVFHHVYRETLAHALWEIKN